VTTPKNLPESNTLVFGEVRDVRFSIYLLTGLKLWTGHDRPHALHGLLSGKWMVPTRDQTIRTTQSGPCVLVLPLLPERLRRPKGRPPLAHHHENFQPSPL